MPLECTVHETPKGRKYVRTHAFGKVGAADAKPVMDKMLPGHEWHGYGVLSVADSGTDLDPEARRIFTSQQDVPVNERPPTAMIVTSAPLRITISFVMKVSGSSPNTKFFGNEAEGTAWLVSELDAKG
ncbi:MAG: hypothetical protein ACO1OB_22240 [Archangium sp.]